MLFLHVVSLWTTIARQHKRSLPRRRETPSTAWLKDPTLQFSSRNTMTVVQEQACTYPSPLQRKLLQLIMPVPAKNKTNTPKFAVLFVSCLLIYSQTSCHDGPGTLAFLSPSRTKFAVFFFTTHVILGFWDTLSPFSPPFQSAPEPDTLGVCDQRIPDPWHTKSHLSAEGEGTLCNIQTSVMHFYKTILLLLHTEGFYSMAS